MIAQLLKYQEIDEKLRAIETEISQSEERKKFGQAIKFLDTAPEKLDKLDSRAGELCKIVDELSEKYKELGENINEYNGMIEISKDIEVVNYYKKNAAKLYEHLKDLKNNINSVIEEIAFINDNFEKMKGQTIAMQRQYKEYKQKYNELKETKENDMKKITAELAKASKGISPELMEKYKLKRQDKIFPILYEVNDKKCTQCGMELSISELSKLGNDRIIECENCRRLIYIKE
jgi:predicted  nucleic acid-binding Zn-ribbon protein